MRWLFLGVVTTACLLPLQAGDKGKAQSLTPKEAAEGWLLLFDGDTTFGWNIAGEGRAREGQLRLGGKERTVATHATVFGSVQLELEYMCQDGARLRSGALTFELASTKRGRLETTLGDPVNQLSFEVPAGHALVIDKLRLKPLGLKSLFNGKDLSGWNVFPGKKSVFAVKDGAINVLDGPGDLQTVGKYGDFLLQLECISNGKHLNSGVFFRCRPNEYQNGYEAQVRNQFTPEPTQEYTVEEYDPKTHRLMGKKKIKATAVDFGTGAIYRRVPARKEVAKDGEWFTMTVVAQGNHFATWVNGIQVVDWVDNRPPSDNARTGYRKEAGHISFQGHDPTTNLSFKNIRIAELRP